MEEEVCTAPAQIPLVKYAAWFIKRIWPCEVHTPYRDVVGLVLRQLNFIDRCLIYNTITGDVWCHDAERMAFESLRVGIIPEQGQLNVKSAPYDIVHKDALRWLWDHSGTDSFIKYTTKCLKIDNIAPLRFQLTLAIDEDDARFLMRLLTRCDHYAAVAMAHEYCTSREFSINDFAVFRRPTTYQFLRDAGYIFRNHDPKGYLLCVPVHEIPVVEMTDVVEWAAEKSTTKWLDIIHTHYSAEEMLRFCVNYYHAPGLKWFIDHGIKIHQFDMTIIESDDFAYLAKLTDDHWRAEMMALGRIGVILHVLSHNEYTWDQTWFERRASLRKIRMVKKHASLV